MGHVAVVGTQKRQTSHRPTHTSRARSVVRTALLLGIIGSLVLAGRAGDANPDVETRQAAPPTPVPVAEPVPVADDERADDPPTSPTTEVTSDSLRPAGRPPAALSIPILGVERASVLAVGTEPDGSMTVPPADSIGWYRFGSGPGGPGSAVLAAHVAAEGRAGVFARLDELEPGDHLTVYDEFDEPQRFTVLDVAYHDKTSLPLDEIFATAGRPVLTLVTCGGGFNESLGAYDGNVVVRAIPA